MATPYGNISYEPALPQGEEQEFSPIQETGSLEGFRVSVAKAFTEGVVPNLLFDLEYGYDKYIQDSPFISEEELKTKDYYRKDLSFPGGTKENVAKLVAEKHDARKERDFLLSTMKPGFLSGTSRFVGNILGFALEPGNAAAAILAPELIGTRAAPFLARAAESANLGARTARFATGAVEGAAAVTPQELINIPSSKLYQDEESSLDAFLNIGLGAGLGGTVHLAFGKYLDVADKRLHNQAKETATSQVFSDKKVNVDPIVKQSVYEKFKTIDENAEAGIGPSRDQIIESFVKDREELVKTLSASDQEISSLKLDKNYIDTKLNDFEPIIDHLSGIAEDIGSNIKTNAKVADNLLSKNDAESIKSRLKAINKKSSIGMEEHEELSKIYSNHMEAKKASVELKKQSKQLKEIQKSIEDLQNIKTKAEVKLSSETMSDKARIKSVDSLRRNVTKISKRLSKKGFDINNKLLPESLNAENVILSAEQKNAQIRSEIARYDDAIDMLIKDHEPVTKEELEAAVDTQEGADSISGVNKSELEAYKESTDSLPDDAINDVSLQELEAEVNELIDSGEVDQKFVEDYRAQSEELPKLHEAKLKAIKVAKDCLGG